MPVLAPNLGPDVVPYVYAVRDELLAPQGPVTQYFSGDCYLTSIRVGEAHYELRRPTRGRVYPLGDGGYEFVVDVIAQYFVGQGATPEAAEFDWRNKVHAAIQQLLATRPFEMGDSDIARWKALEALVDTSQYRRATPVRMRQLGRVEYLRHAFPKAVHWAGTGREQVALEAMPPEFAGFKPGQWIEAICERDPLTGRLLRATHVQPITEIRLMTQDRQTEFLQSLPSGKDLPEPELGWTGLE